MKSTYPIIAVGNSFPVELKAEKTGVNLIMTGTGVSGAGTMDFKLESSTQVRFLDTYEKPDGFRTTFMIKGRREPTWTTEVANVFNNFKVEQPYIPTTDYAVASNGVITFVVAPPVNSFLKIAHFDPASWVPQMAFSFVNGSSSTSASVEHAPFRAVRLNVTAVTTASIVAHLEA